MISKKDMQRQLREFMGGFAQSIGRMYGSEKAGALIGYPGEDVNDIEREDARVETSLLWTTLSQMYDYGIQGLTHKPITMDPPDGEFADVKLFLDGLDSLNEYLDEDRVVFPTLARRAMRASVARWVLDGGMRYTGNEDEINGALSFAELALLADMDERSVRNAASGATPALKSEAVGKRSIVPIEEAQRWLAGRKGFVPTRVVGRAELLEPPATIVVRSSTSERIHKLAADAGLTVNQFLSNLLEEKQQC